MAKIRHAVALTLIVAVLLVACQPEGRTFQTTLPIDERDPLPVTLTDETGLVTGIAPAAVDPAWNDFVPALHADPSAPNAAVLSWLGGTCDQDTTVRFHEQHGGYLLNVTVDEKLGFGGCVTGAMPRAIRIATSSPIPVASVTVAGNGSDGMPAATDHSPTLDSR